MRKSYFVIWIILSAFLSTLIFAQDPANFGTSLHKTREGKRTWYKSANGGFENITNIPVEDVNCLKCHPGTKADETPIDPATYTPDCYDCHNFSQGTTSTGIFVIFSNPPFALLYQVRLPSLVL